MTSAAPVIIRQATAADDPALARLASLDSNAVPGGTVFVAEQNGELRAAISVESGRAIADPFHPTAELVALLRYSRNSRPAVARKPRGGVRQLVARIA